jgi:hypothetical protein
MASRRHAIAEVGQTGAVETGISSRFGFYLPAWSGARATARIKLGETQRVVGSFFQQPGAKGRYLRQFRRRFRTYDPERKRCFKSQIERPDQAPGD